MALIPLTEWAAKHGINESTARQRARRGSTPAVKMGRDWMIEEDTPLDDLRQSYVRDGWHVIIGREVCVEDGLIVRGLIKDINDSYVTAYVYRRQRDGSWSREDSISASAFRSGVRRGTIKLA